MCCFTSAANSNILLEYLGCFVGYNATDSDLNGDEYTSNSDLSPETCIQMCDGYSYHFTLAIQVVLTELDMLEFNKVLFAIAATATETSEQLITAPSPVLET